MIAPSPDWFVGVHDLDLCDSSGQWRSEVVVDLLPYDAGTDSGPSYTSSDADTSPKQAITALVSPPLGDGKAAPKLGTFTFKKK